MKKLLWMLLLLPCVSFAQEPDVFPVDISCDAPTEFVDGSPIDVPLTFNFYWGRDTGNLPNSLTGVDSCAATLALPAGIWRIISVATCEGCIDSAPTPEITIVVTGPRQPSPPRNLRAIQRQP